MHSRRDVLTGLLTGAAVAGLPAIARSQSAQATRLVIGMPVGPRTLEPTREVSNVLFRTAYNIYDTLIAIDFKNDARLVPGLATAWKRQSPTVVELTLRDGVRFHDGSIMTAEDVAFSFGTERMGEKSPGHQLTRPFVGSFERVEAVDARTVRVVARNSDPLIEQRLASWGSQIVSKKAFLAVASTDGKDFGAWERAPVATGPYRVKEFRTDDRIVLEAHDGYFGGRPNAKEVVFRVMPEASSRYAALAAGDIDIATEMSVDQIPTIEKHKGLKVLGGPIQNIRVLVYDKTHPVLADVRIRRALSLAIDRRTIVDSLYLGRTEVPRSFQNPAFGALYDAQRPLPAFDPDRARALVKESGYRGQPIPYKVMTNYYTLQIQTAQVLVEMWRAVGLNVVIAVKENVAQVSAPEDRGIRDWSNTIFFNDPVGVLWRLYGPRGIVQRVTKEWTNEAFNKLGEVLETSTDLEERRRAFRGMLEIYEDVDPPGTVLHDLTMFYGVRPGVDWSPYPIEYMDLRPTNLSLRT